MTSAAVVAANRANAARSTGPRTPAGKAVVARNALRHGLSVSVLGDPALAAAVTALALRIAGEGAPEERRAVALRIAEAQVDVERIRRVRTQIMTEGFAAAGDITARLMRLDRYERRALSRRRARSGISTRWRGWPSRGGAVHVMRGPTGRRHPDVGLGRT